MDNRIENLEWCTQKENIQHVVINNLGVGKSLRKQRKVKQYDVKGNFIKEFKGMNEASRQTKICEGNIWKCCARKRKSAGGYIWKYA